MRQLEFTGFRGNNGAPVHEDVLITGEIPFVDPGMVSSIGSSCEVFHTSGAVGPYGLDADGWR